MRTMLLWLLAAAPARALVGGTAVDPENSGFLSLRATTGTCTGVMIAPTTFLTSERCFGDDELMHPEAIGWFMGSQDSDDNPVVQFVRLRLEGEPGLALGRLAHPVRLSATPPPLYRAPVGDLDHAELDCFSYGPLVLDHQPVYGATLGTAHFTVRSRNHTHLNMLSAPLEPFDTGAVCFDRARPMEVAAVVTSTFTVTAVPDYREWAAMFNAEHDLVVQHSGLCVGAGGTGDGAPLIQTGCLQTESQRFHLQHSNGLDGGDDSLYAIRVADSDRCLDVSGASTSDGARVIQWPCSGLVLDPVPGRHPTRIPQNQWWSPKYLGDGVFQLESANSGKCLAVAGGSVSDGAALEQRTCDGTLAQQRWRISATGFSAESHALVDEDGTCLDAPSATELTAIGVRSCDAGNNQQWRLDAVPQRFTVFMSAISGFANALTRTPDGVIQRLWNVTFDQQWRMEWRPWGYALRSRMDDPLCLEKNRGRSVALLPCGDDRRAMPISDQRWHVR